MDQKILKQLEACNDLPILPAVALEVIRVCRDPGCGIDDMQHLIGRDPTLTAKVLRTVNSAMFGLSRRVTSLKQALTLLGLASVRAIVLSFSLVKLDGANPPRSFDHQRHWKQSLTNAVSAHELCARHELGVPEEAFVAGLLQDVGILALVQAVPDAYEQVLARMAESGESRIDAERHVLGADHMEVGTWLADRWGLPVSLCTPIAYHHQPEQYVGTDADVGSLTRLLCAGALTGELFHDAGKGRSREQLTDFLDRELSMSADDVDAFLSSLTDKVAEAAEVLDIEIGPQQDYASILAEANAELGRLSMEATKESTQARVREMQLETRNQDLEQEHQRLRDQAVRDGLTGIFNRGFFDQVLIKEYRRCMRHHRRVGLIFVDLDHFKQVNDTYGHPLGDTVLCRVADTLRESIRTSDVLARYGGEEFVVLAIEPTEVGLQQVAERLRLGVADLRPTVEGRTVRVTASIGAAVVQPRRDEQDGEKRLVEAADQAMYQAKEDGRNRVCFRSLLDPADRQIDGAVEAMRFSRHLLRKGLVARDDLSKALCTHENKRFKSGYLAVQMGILDEAQLYTILDEQARTNRRFGEIAVGRGLLTPRQIFWLLAVQKENPETLGAALVASHAIGADRLQRAVQEYAEFGFGSAQPVHAG